MVLKIETDADIDESGQQEAPSVSALRMCSHTEFPALPAEGRTRKHSSAQELAPFPDLFLNTIRH